MVFVEDVESMKAGMDKNVCVFQITTESREFAEPVILTPTTMVEIVSVIMVSLVMLTNAQNAIPHVVNAKDLKKINVSLAQMLAMTS